MAEVELIKRYLEASILNGDLDRYNLKSLVSPDNNHKSAIQALDAVVLVKLSTNTKFRVNLILKMEPCNINIRNFFKIGDRFRNEILFYKKILPCIQEFRRKRFTKSLKCCPSYYGNEILDNYCEVLILQNLKSKGYGIGPRSGLDLPTSMVVMAKLGQLHGSAIMLRLCERRTFTHFKVQTDRFQVFSDEVVKRKITKTVVSVCCENPNLSILSTRIESAMKLSNNSRSGSIFNTFIHGDLSTNNIMVKPASDGNTIDVKFIDFQRYRFNSLTKDLLYFLFGSVNLEVCKKHYMELVEEYHLHLVNTMKNFISYATAFSMYKLLLEIKQEATKTFPNLMELMLTELTLPSSELLDESNEIEPERKERMWFIMEEFSRRLWI